MSVEVPIHNYDDMSNILDTVCKCGHKLSEHGFTEGVNYLTGKTVVVVSICAFCKCRKFEQGMENRNEDRYNL